jgi:hypothetical protein
MRKFWILVCVLGMPCVASAQWENLNTLQAGQRIQVVEVNSKKDSGTFLGISDKTISLQGKSGEQTIQRQDVRSVKFMENKHRLRNTLIGATVGAGAGAGISVGMFFSNLIMCFIILTTAASLHARGIALVMARDLRTTENCSMDLCWILLPRVVNVHTSPVEATGWQ